MLQSSATLVKGKNHSVNFIRITQLLMVTAADARNVLRVPGEIVLVLQSVMTVELSRL